MESFNDNVIERLKNNSLIELCCVRNKIYYFTNEYFTTEDRGIIQLKPNYSYDKILQLLSEELKYNSSLRTLLLNFNKKKINDGFKYIIDALNINTSLINLNLTYYYITDTEFNYLCNALKVNSSLSCLCLDFNNKLTDIDYKCLSDALIVNSSLTELYISNSHILSKGFKYM